jgi:hypothetical protein
MNTNTATEYRNLPLAVLTESATNPRRIFGPRPGVHKVDQIEIKAKSGSVLKRQKFSFHFEDS